MGTPGRGAPQQFAHQDEREGTGKHSVISVTLIQSTYRDRRHGTLTRNSSKGVKASTPIASPVRQVSQVATDTKRTSRGSEAGSAPDGRPRVVWSDRP